MKVLVAEDDALTRKVLTQNLARMGFEVVAACDGSEAWELLSADEPADIAVLDWMMPGRSGLEICRALRKGDRGRYTYVLVLTARDQTDDVVAAFEAGADDYVVKGVDSREFEARLRAAERIVTLENELRWRATRDGLTGVLNASTVREQLDIEISRAQRLGASVGLVMLDADHFKHVNDTFGHRAGDRVLQEIASRLKEELRKYDSLGRYGGEEFLVIAPNVDLGGCRAIADRLRTAVSVAPVCLEGSCVAVSASFGVTVADPTVGLDADEALRRADEALYEAKRSGRNAVCEWRGPQSRPAA